MKRMLNAESTFDLEMVKYVWKNILATKVLYIQICLLKSEKVLIGIIKLAGSENLLCSSNKW